MVILKAPFQVKRVFSAIYLVKHAQIAFPAHHVISQDSGFRIVHLIYQIMEARFVFASIDITVRTRLQIVCHAITHAKCAPMVLQQLVSLAMLCLFVTWIL